VTDGAPQMLVPLPEQIQSGIPADTARYVLIFLWWSLNHV